MMTYMARLSGKVHVEAPIDKVWNVMTRTGGGGGNSNFGVEEIRFIPDKPRMERDMKILLKLSIAVFKGLVVINIDEVNDDKYYFDTSLIQAPQGIRGSTRVGLQRSAEIEDESDLLYSSNLKVPMYMNLVMGGAQRLVDDNLMPGLARTLARVAKRDPV